MQRPCVARQQLALCFQAGIGVPELRAQHQATEGLSAAGVGEERVGMLGAGVVRRFWGTEVLDLENLAGEKGGRTQLTGVVDITLAVQRGLHYSDERNDGSCTQHRDPCAIESALNK